jgi:hypothetical protein
VQLTVLGYCTLVIDPEGEHGGLDVLPGVHVVGRDAALPDPAVVVAGLRDGETTLVDLSRCSGADDYLHRCAGTSEKHAVPVASRIGWCSTRRNVPLGERGWCSPTTPSPPASAS